MRVTIGRLTSGVMGGLVGGLLFGAMMLTRFIASPLDTGRTGLAELLRQFLGTSSPVAVWTVHILTSLVLGAVYSALFAPRGYARNVTSGVLFGVAADVLGAFFVLRGILGVPLAFDAGAVFTLVGHAVYGAGLGATYVAFHRLEVREALDARDERWRAWGERESHRSRGA